MKPITWVIIAILLIGGAGFAYWFFYIKKKTTTIKTDINKNPVNTTTQTVQANESVRDLQKMLNAALPSTSVKLVEDGIMGPKTQAALDTLNALKKANKIEPAKKGAVDTVLNLGITLKDVLNVSMLPLEAVGNGVSQLGSIATSVGGFFTGFHI